MMADGTTLDLDPDFQRGHVWTEEQQRAFVEFVLRRGDVAKTILFANVAPPKSWHGHWGELSLVDGKQRLEAVRSLTRGDLTVFHDHRPGGYHWSELHESLTSRVHASLRFTVVNLPNREAVLDLYLALNAGGTPHTVAELDRVRALRAKL